MKIKFNDNNTLFNLIDYYFNSNNTQSYCFIDKTQNIKSIEELQNFFNNLTPFLTITILDDNNNIIQIIDNNIIFQKVELKEHGLEDCTNKEIFYVTFHSTDINTIIAKNTANIDYLATMLDIELEEM